MRFVGQVIGIYADAVTAHQPGAERQKVPFGFRRLQHFRRVDSDLIENDGQLIHKRDIKVSLGVLDDLGGFCYLDAGGTVYARRDNRFVQICDFLARGTVVAGDDFDDIRQCVLLIARIDTLRGVAYMEVSPPFHARGPLQHGYADLFGRAWIHGRFVDDNGALFQLLAHGLAGFNHWRKIRLVCCVHGCGNGDDDEISLREYSGVAGQGEMGRAAQIGGRHFADRIEAALVAFDLLAVGIVAVRRPYFSKLHCQWQAHIPQPDDCNDAHNVVLSHLVGPALFPIG